MAKSIAYQREVAQKISGGLEKMTEAIAGSHGPEGKYCLITNASGETFWTKNAQTITSHMHLSDPVERIASEIIKEALKRSDLEQHEEQIATLTLARSLFLEGIKKLEKGASASEIKRGLTLLLKDIFLHLERHKMPLQRDEICKMATFLAEGDTEMARDIETIIEKTGGNTFVSFTRAENTHSLFFEEHFGFDFGLASPYFVTHRDTLSTFYQNPRFFLSTAPIETAKEAAAILEAFYKNSQKTTPLILVAADFSKEALSTLTLNKVKGEAPIAAIAITPNEEEGPSLFEDLSVMTGSKIYSSKSTCLDATCFGRAEAISIEREKTAITPEPQNRKKIDAYIDKLSSALKGKKEPERAPLEKRIDRLTAKKTLIGIQSLSKADRNDKIARYRRSLTTIKKALIEPILPSLNRVLPQALQELSTKKIEGEKSTALDLVTKALSSTLQKSKEVPSAVPTDKGSFAAKETLSSAKNTLRCAFSLASSLLSIDCAIYRDKPSSKQET